jgi:hypothetical protein
MSIRFFNQPKIRCYLDGFSPGEEKRRGEATKVIKMSLRVQPFDAKLAVSIDEGLAGESSVRSQLFSLQTAEPRPMIDRLNMKLSVPRQTLRLFMAPDQETCRVALSQVRIHGAYARTQKDQGGFAFCFKGTFGPVGRDELELLQLWYLNTMFVTFEEAEPSMEFDPIEPGEDEDVPSVAELSRPLPSWDDAPPSGAPAAVDAAAEAPADAPGVAVESEHARETGAPRPARRGRNKATRHNPEEERQAQAKAGQRTH